MASGDGVVDLEGIVAVLARPSYHGVLSVESDTLQQARRSFAYLGTLLAGSGN